MKLLIDQDQVICKWAERILERYNVFYKTSFTRDDVKDYWAMETILGPQGIPFMKACSSEPEFYTRLDPVEGAVEGMKTLHDAGHELRIVSAVPIGQELAYHGKAQWLRDHIPWFDLKNFFAVHKKDEVVGDLLLDDSLKNIDSFAATGSVAVIFDCPWNQNYDPLPGRTVKRVKSWPEFLALVKKLERKS